MNAPDAALLRTTVEELVRSLGLRTDSVTVSEGPRIVVQISSPDGEALTGSHGEHLQALNVIARRLVESRSGAGVAGFLIDVNGYHEGRLEALRKEVMLQAERARLFKHEVELHPMSSYERLVVHELFANDPEIETTSQGEGKTRHIVLKYKNAAV